jgi:hypothetical protein
MHTSGQLRVFNCNADGQRIHRETLPYRVAAAVAGGGAEEAGGAAAGGGVAGAGGVSTGTN